MRRLVFLFAIVFAMLSISCSKENSNEPENTGEQTVTVICPSQDASDILLSKNFVASCIKDAIADNEIDDMEVVRINDAICEYQCLDAEIKTKYLDDKKAQDELLSIINAETNYSKYMSLAIGMDGYDAITTKVR